MKDRIKNKDDKNANGWVWIGLLIAFLAVADNDNGRNRSREKKKETSAQVTADRIVSSREPFVFEGSPMMIDTEELARHAGKESQTVVSRGGSRVIVTDKDGAVVTETVRGTSADPAGGSRDVSRPLERHVVVVTDEKGKRIAEAAAASVTAQTDGRMKELEAKLSEAGEKLRAAAERAGAKVTERSRDAIVSRILGETSKNLVPSVPPVPPVPPAPPGIPDLNPKHRTTGVAVKQVQVRSGPCATREKAIREARTNLEKIVSARLSVFGLSNGEYLEKAIERLNPKFEVEESFREVAGERYPLYVASAEIDLGSNFERQALELVNQQTAHHRFAGLMGLSFGLVALLIGVDRLVLGRSRSEVPTADKSLV